MQMTQFVCIWQDTCIFSKGIYFIDTVPKPGLLPYPQFQNKLPRWYPLFPKLPISVSG